MSRGTRLRLVALVSLLVWLAAACGSDRKAAEEPTTGETSTTAAAREATFGDAPWPCGPAKEANIDPPDPGVSATEVRIATGDDAGFATSPGLNHEITDAMKALVAKCNELGGIHGRKIVLNYYDAKILEVKTAMTQACQGDNFFLVGEGWALDSGQEEIRVGCGLPAVPTYTVSAAFAMAPNVYQGVPNPADEIPLGIAYHMAKIAGDKIKKAGTLAANYSATQETRDKVLAAYPSVGFTFIKNLEYNVTGEADWTPFVKQLQDAGVEFLYFSGSCLPNFQKFAQAAKANNYRPIIQTDANFYEAKCAAANTDGAMDFYMRMAFIPMEEANVNKATKDYVDLLKDAGGDVALLGMQATSSFLFWATAASKCGANLTRQCVIDNMAKVRSWTGHGLHAETDPGDNHPPFCNLTLRLQGTSFVRVMPEKPGTFDCDKEKYIGKVTGVKALEPLKLDANRKSHQFDK
jgi:ABC-type branched-subunit amino acid transport system substrate-binding protein